MDNISPVSKSLLTGQTETLLVTQALAARKRPKRRRWGRWMGVMGLLVLGGITVFFAQWRNLTTPTPYGKNGSRDPSILNRASRRQW